MMYVHSPPSKSILNKSNNSNTKSVFGFNVGANYWKTFLYKILPICLMVLFIFYLYSLFIYNTAIDKGYIPIKFMDDWKLSNNNMNNNTRNNNQLNEFDTELTVAIESLEMDKLELLIKRAETKKLQSRLLHSAKYLLRKLAEDNTIQEMRDIQTKPTKPPDVTAPIQTLSNQGKIIKNKLTSSPPSKPIEKPKYTPVVTKHSSKDRIVVESKHIEDGLFLPDHSHFEGLLTNTSDQNSYSPINPSWYNYQNHSKVFPYLPKLPASGFPFPIHTETEDIIQKRFDSIVSFYPEFPPSSFPIGVVACCRPKALEQSLISLSKVQGINFTNQVTVYQDGYNDEVATVARQFKVKLVQNGEAKGDISAGRISKHYKFTFSHLFDDNPNSDYVIVVEDDMIFSPDFLLYFTQTAHLYQSDPTIYCISSWNDNGFIGKSYDPRYVYRTDFFIGLGWLVNRKIYKGEFEPIWPLQHWDHWMREAAQRKGRQCIYPEISRNYNIGKRGTHSDDNLFAQYFERIVFNQQEAVYLGNMNRLIKSEYDQNYLHQIRNAKLVESVQELDHAENTTMKLYYNNSPGHDIKEIWEMILSVYIGLWHSIPIRAEYSQSVFTRIGKNNQLFLIAATSEIFQRENNKQSIKLFEPKDFYLDHLRDSMEIVIADRGQSCMTTCRNRIQKCAQLALHLVNNCDQLNKAFNCSSCEGQNNGKDHPAYVSDLEHGAHGKCLFNNKQEEVRCHGEHEATTRLCVCEDY